MTDTPETPSEIDEVDAKFWLNEIEAAKARQEDWYKSAEKAIDRYKDCKDRVFGFMNILWSNVSVQQAALGDDFGKPSVSRVNTPTGQEGLTRCVASVMEDMLDGASREDGDNHEIRNAVHDVLLPGRGQVWLELNPIEDEEGNVVWIETPLARVEYRDYLEGPSTRWATVPWVARGHLFTLDDLKKMGVKNADQVPRNYSLPCPKDKVGAESGAEQFKRARVWEIWDKHNKRRVYVAEGWETALKVDADPYRLRKFFPCPRAIVANSDEGWQVPLTDYSRYIDQAEELDEICSRIFVLTAVLRRRGVHDKKFKEMADLANAGDNVSFAVENWAELQQGGGLAQAMQWEDLTPVITVLVELHKQRRELMALIYELTGISDLARGMTDPNETLGAQKLKQIFGSGRFKDRQKESRRFAAEAYQLKGELLSEMAPREQIEEMSGIYLPTVAEKQDAAVKLQKMQAQAQAAQQAGQPVPFDQDDFEELQARASQRFTWEKVSGVLRTDRRRCYMTEIETDQTEFVDEEADKAARLEFIGQANTIMQTFGPMIAGNPGNGPVIKEIMMFGLSGFKAGRAVEENFERVIDGAIQQAGQQQGQQQPSPEAIKLQIAQTGLQTAQVKLETEKLRAQNAGMKAQTEAQQGNMKAIEAQQKVQAQHDANQAKREGQQIDNIGKVEDLQFERATRATATEALLHGPTRAPQSNGAR